MRRSKIKIGIRAGQRLERKKFLLWDRYVWNDAYIPDDMYKDGLIIIGNNESKRCEFTHNYTNSLLSQSKKIIYITDETLPNLDKFDIESFKGLFSLDNSKISTIELGDPLVSNMICNGDEVQLTIIHYSDKYPFVTDSLIENYNVKLNDCLSRLSVLSPDILKEHVIIINDSAFRNNHKQKLNALIRSLTGKVAGLILSGEDTGKYENEPSKMRHIALFKTYDPLSILHSLDIAKITSERINQRDLVSVNRNSFYYFDRDNVEIKREINIDR